MGCFILFYFCLNLHKSGLYITPPAHLISRWPHFVCSIDTCDWWFSYWTAQIWTVEGFEYALFACNLGEHLFPMKNKE